MVVTNGRIATRPSRSGNFSTTDKPGYHAALQNRTLKDGPLNAYWVQVINDCRSDANSNGETSRLSRPGRISSSSPTPIRLGDRVAADLILPTAMRSRRKAPTATQKRCTDFLGTNLLQRGASRSDLAATESPAIQVQEASPEELLTKKPDIAARRCSTWLYRMERSTIFRSATSKPAMPTTAPEPLASTYTRACSRICHPSGAGMGMSRALRYLSSGARHALLWSTARDAVALP